MCSLTLDQPVRTSRGEMHCTPDAPCAEAGTCAERGAMASADSAGAAKAHVHAAATARDAPGLRTVNIVPPADGPVHG